MVSNGLRIIREENFDDGTTGGQTLYQTNDGRWWKESVYSKETSPTGVEVRTVDRFGKLI